MDRRKFLKRSTVLAAGSIIIDPSGVTNFQEKSSSNMDRFGGNPAVKGKTTGFFHTEKINDKWWVITPDGNSFLVTGCNHITRAYIQADYNRQQWGELAGSPEKFYNYAVNDLKSWNMTTYGYGEKIRTRALLPYVINCSFPATNAWQDVTQFPDVFSDEFIDKCISIAKTECFSRKDDPFLVGYYLCDVPEWPNLNRVSKRRPANWIDNLKGHDASSKGKQVYVKLMKERHGSINSFNGTYGTRFNTFDDLLNDHLFVLLSPKNYENARADDDAFSDLLIRQYYKVTVGAIREYDKDHMILGEIAEGNRGIHPTVLKMANEYCDVLSIQYYGIFKNQYQYLKRWHQETGLPVLLADSCFAVKTDKMPDPCGVRVEDENERALHFEIFTRQAFSEPFFIGWLWCGYIDSWKEREDRRQHTGLKDAFGNPYLPITNAMKNLFSNIYGIHNI